MDIYDAADVYKKRGNPLIVIAGADYGMGSSRDWAAKGTRLLGVRAVVATSYERIHRSNLIGMGVLPLQFKENEDRNTYGLQGDELFSLPDLSDSLKPGDEIQLKVHRSSGEKEEIPVICRLDTDIEMTYYRHGGILPYVLRQIIGKAD